MRDVLQTLMNPHGHLRESLVFSWVSGWYTKAQRGSDT